MTKRLYYEFFYYHSIPEMLLWGVLLVGAWTVLAILINPKYPKLWRNLNRVVLFVVVGFIYWTLGKRGSGEREASLIPFYSFVAAQTSSERYRSLVANILLFIPLGLSIPFSFRLRHPVRRTILTAFILSLSIEAIQYIFALGLCELDDVIFNTIGAVAGSMSFVMWRAREKQK